MCWLIIDIDPASDGKSRRDRNSDEVQLSLCLDKQHQILETFPELIESSYCGSSGNGAYILLRLPNYRNEKQVNNNITIFMKYLSKKYSDHKVTVDADTRNPSRLLSIPGTKKCKASIEDANHPYRIVTIGLSSEGAGNAAIQGSSTT